MQRYFIPGSEWIYLKLYTGYKSADNILLNRIYPLILDLKKEKLISNFFFIRYSDPQPHIRLRIKTNSQAYYTPIFQKIYESFHPCIDNGLLISVVCDTYQRELERYGETTMELAEQLFDIDSLAVLELLKVLHNSNSPEQERWLLSLRLIDELLMAFNYDLQAKSIQVGNYSQSYLKEFHFDRKYCRQLDDKYRNNRLAIEQTLQGLLLKEYDKILLNRMQGLRLIGKQLYNYEMQGNLMVNGEKLVNSYMHMTMNRLFRSKNRIYEMVVYYFLDKYYKSEIAKKKYNGRLPIFKRIKAAN